MEVFNGQILVTQMHSRQLGKLEAGAAANVRIHTLASAVDDGPNDLVSWRNQAVFLTVPATRRVLRYVPGQDLKVVWQGPPGTKPNGIALAPDAGTLYVTDTYWNLVRAFRVDDQGQLSEDRVLARWLGLNEKAAELITDGMAVDRAGNLYIATYERPDDMAPGEIAVLRPTGRRWGRLIVPTGPTNCTFGDADGRTLYITARGALYRVRLQVPGPAGKG
jgi:gluconolactonase